MTRTRGVDALRRQTDARSYGGACSPVSRLAANTSLHRSSRSGFGRVKYLCFMHALSKGVHMTAQPAAPEAPPSPAPTKAATCGTAAAGTSLRRLKRAHTHRWTKADNAAWWAARRAALKARGGPARESCASGVKLFEQFVYCG